MRVLIPDAGDPVPTFIERLIEGVSGCGVDVAVMPSPSPAARRGQSAAAKARALVLDRGTTILEPGLRARLAAADIVHCQWPPSFVKLRPALERAGKPVLLSLRGRLVNVVPFLAGNEVYRSRLEQALAACTAMHAVSADMGAVAATLGADPARMTVIRPAVDTTAITPAPPRPAGGDIVVAMVGGLIWRKGYEYALCALRAARDRGAECRLEIAGEGPDRERIEAAIGDLGLGRSVHLHGQLHPADILGLLRRSDVFLHSSLSEGISNAVLEAMATGLPVVTTDAGGMAEVVTDGVEGCLAKRRDVAGLADGLVTLAGDTARRRSMGEAARRRVETDFDLRDHAAQFASLYHRVLAAC